MKNVAIVVLMLAVMAYTIFNYATGKMTTGTFLVYMAILGLPLLNMINILIQQRKNRD